MRSYLIHREQAGIALSHFFFVRVHFSQARLARSDCCGLCCDLVGEWRSCLISMGDVERREETGVTMSPGMSGALEGLLCMLARRSKPDICQRHGCADLLPRLVHKH